MTSSQSRCGRWTPLTILAVVAGFIVWWPLGLAALGYTLWAGPVDRLADEGAQKLRESFGRRGGSGFYRGFQKSSSGNAAFDAYRAETLQRLEAEQAEFAEHLKRLREARDREEFERFMAERKTQS